MTARSLVAAFSTWSGEGQPLVLATVFDTAGSTYSKCGEQMLITGDGRFQGMLSGGCLEGDLAERARAVLDTGQSQSVTYDLGQDDTLWGLGVGCDGLMKIFLQPLSLDRQYEPFAAMAKALMGDSTQAFGLVIESEDPKLPPGSAMVTGNDDAGYADIPAEFAPSLRELVDKAIGAESSGHSPLATTVGDATVLYAVLQPPPEVLVLGAGLDAEPVVRFALELGWRVTVQDHRPAYIERGDFTGAERKICVPAGSIASALDLNRYSAAVVMSHHLISDREYLQQIAQCGIAYVGLLGPLDRRRRLMTELGDDAGKLEGRLQGPAGIDIGGRGPSAIALSIVAGIHRALFGGPHS